MGWGAEGAQGGLKGAPGFRRAGLEGGGEISGGDHDLVVERAWRGEIGRKEKGLTSRVARSERGRGDERVDAGAG